MRHNKYDIYNIIPGTIVIVILWSNTVESLSRTVLIIQNGTRVRIIKFCFFNMAGRAVRLPEKRQSHIVVAVDVQQRGAAAKEAVFDQTEQMRHLWRGGNLM